MTRLLQGLLYETSVLVLGPFKKIAEILQVRVKIFSYEIDLLKRRTPSAVGCLRRIFKTAIRHDLNGRADVSKKLGLMTQQFFSKRPGSTNQWLLISQHFYLQQRQTLFYQL